MAGIKFDITGNNQGILRSLNQTQSAFKDTARAAEAEGMKIEDVFDRIKQAATMTIAGISAKEFIQKMVQVRGEFQQLEIAFTTMLQSEEKANELMNQLVKTAAITPFDLKGVSEGAKQLLAYGTAVEEVNEMITRLGDIAAGLSIPLGDLVYLYGTTMVQGRMFTNDLRQFQGRGIPIAEEIAKIMGVTKDAVDELVTAGKVTDQVFHQAILNMTNEGSKFGGLMEAQSKTITGQISNIEDALDMMFNDLGKKSEGVINDALGGVSYLVEHYEAVGKVILSVAAAYGAYKGALFAVIAAQKLAAVWGEVQAFFSLAKSITSAKDAMLLLNMAVKANPLGLLLSVVTALATSFALFSSNEGKAAEMTAKFGERAVTAINRVKTLTTTLNGLTAGTSTHKKVMEELNGILQEYGIEAIKEGDSIDSVNEKREKSIELIKREAIERQRANNLEMGMTEYNQKIADAQKKLYENLTGAQTVDLDLGLVGWISGNKELQENASAISAIIANVVERDITKIAGKTGKEYEDGLKEIFATIQERMRKIGISEETIESEWLTDNLFNHQNLVQNYIEAIQEADEAHTRYADMVNKSADAERDAADGATTYAEKLNAIESSLQGPNDSVRTLYNNIKTLMSQYTENTIGFTIRIGGEVPKWMETMDIPQLQQLAKRFSALGAANPNGVIISGRHWSRQELLQRGADYATAADQKQTKKEADERAAREAAKEEEKRKKERERGAKQRAREAEQLRKQTERYNKLTADLERESSRQHKDMILSTRQAEIDALDESTRKTLDQLRLDFDKRKVEIERGYEDLKQSKIDKARQLWEANPANKGKSFDESTVNTDYTQDELDNYHTQIQANIAEYARSIKELSEAEIQSMYDYLKEYGSVQSMKLAVKRDYDAKIAKEEDVWRKKSLEKEKQATIDNLTAENLLKQIDLGTVFADYGKVLAAPLEETIDRLEEYTKSASFKMRSFEDQKSVYEAIQNAKRQLGGISSVSFGEIGLNLYEYNNALIAFNAASKEMEQAADEVIDAENELVAAQQALAKATTDEAKATAQQAVNRAKDKKESATGRYSSSESSFLAAQVRLSETQQAASSSLSQFQQSVENVGNMAKAVASGSMKQFWDALGTKTQTRIAQFVSGTRSYSKAINEITSTLSKQDKGLDFLVNKIKGVAEEIYQSGEDIESSGIGEKITNLFADMFGTDSKDINKLGSEITNVISNVLSKAKEEGKETSDAVKKAGEEAVKAISKNGGSLWVMIVGLILDLLDVLKEGIGSLVESLLNSVGAAIDGILTEIGSGKIFERIATGIGNVIGGIVKGVGNLFTGGLLNSGNESDMEERINELSIANKALATSIDSLAEVINKKDSTNDESYEAYMKALQAEKDWEKNQREAINSRASEWTNSGYGFLGLGGKSSFNAHMAGDDWAGWQSFTNALKEHGINKEVNRNNIWELTPEEMKILRDFRPSEWASLFNGDGHRNPQDLVNEYIERAGQQQQLTSALNEKLTGYSWDGFLDAYKNLLKDLDSTTEDFAEHMQELIQNALIEGFVNSAAVKDKIDELYNKIADYASPDSEGGTTLTEGEINDIKAANDDIANTLLAWREAAQQAGIINTSSNPYEQNVSSGGWESMGQDTADELNGRFTALQIAGESINAKMDVVISAINALQSASSGGFDVGHDVNEILGLVWIINSNIDSMNDRMKKYYEKWDKIFDDIEKNTHNL